MMQFIFKIDQKKTKKYWKTPVVHHHLLLMMSFDLLYSDWLVGALYTTGVGAVVYNAPTSQSEQSRSNDITAHSCTPC